MADLADRLRIPLVRLSYSGKLRALAELAQAFDSMNLVLVPIGLPLGPRDLLAQVRKHHRSTTNQCTLVPDLPQLFGPQIYTRESIETLSSLAVPGLSSEPANLVQQCLLVQTQDPNEPLLRAIPFLATQRFGLRNRDVPFQAVFENSRDVEIFRLVAGQTSKPPVFLAGEGLSHFKTLLTRDAEKYRQSEFVLGTRRPQQSSLTRVLFVSVPSAFSGAEEVLCTVSENLDPNRFESYALLGAAGHFSARIADAVKQVITVEADFSKPNLRSLRMVCDAINAADPDIVHCNGIIGFPLLAALKFSGRRWIQHIHTVDVQSLSEQLEGASAIIAVSNFVAERLLYLDLDPGRIVVVRNCVDSTRRFCPSLADGARVRRELGIPNDSFVVSYPARLALPKRHYTLLAAFVEVLKMGRRAHLVLAGGGTEADTYDDIHDFIQNNDLEDHVSECSFVSDMPSLYAASNVVAFPAEHEPLGLGILEAMAMRVPVVASPRDSSGRGDRTAGSSSRRQSARYGNRSTSGGPKA